MRLFSLTSERGCPSGQLRQGLNGHRKEASLISFLDHGVGFGVPADGLEFRPESKTALRVIRTTWLRSANYLLGEANGVPIKPQLAVARLVDMEFNGRC